LPTRLAPTLNHRKNIAVDSKAESSAPSSMQLMHRVMMIFSLILGQIWSPFHKYISNIYSMNLRSSERLRSNRELLSLLAYLNLFDWVVGHL
jgi:hypothetical protein